jgi:Tol biopolymer transport system component
MKNTKTFGLRLIGLVAMLAWTMAAGWAANSYFAESVNASPHYAGLDPAFPDSDNSFAVNLEEDDSPDGPPQSIAFHSNREGNNEIYVMNPDGSEQTRLTENTADDQRPDISPNGNQIVFSSRRMTDTNPTGDFELFIMNADGSDVTQLTFNTAVDSWARWSPNGKWIAFHSDAGGNFEIYVIRPDGSELTNVTNYSGLDQFPEWSPNGKQLVIRRDTSLYLIDADGDNPVLLAASAGFNQMGSFSPNGKQIAFMSTREGYPSVFVMDADGSTDPVNLTPKPDAVPANQWSSRAPDWSRNGQSIYFTGRRPETGANEKIFVMNSDGTGATQLTIESGNSAEAAVR